MSEAVFVPGHEAPTGCGAGWWFVFRGDRLLVFEGEAPGLPRDSLGFGDSAVPHFLGTLDGEPCWAVEAPAGSGDAPAGMAWHGLRRLFGRLPDPLVGVAARASQVVEWDRSHRFCGRCGAPTRPQAGERVRECPACGHAAYPRLSPVAMVLVREGDRILLAHQSKWPAGFFSALAGFVEPGETLEQAAAREVREEVGLEIRNLRYFGSQSWPFPHSMMIAFAAERAGGELRPDGVEIESAEWFGPDRLPELPPPVSIARRLIEAVLAEIRQARG